MPRIFMFGMGRHFTSSNELGDFLGLPVEGTQLVEKVRKYKLARRSARRRRRGLGAIWRQYGWQLRDRLGPSALKFIETLAAPKPLCHTRNRKNALSVGLLWIALAPRTRSGAS